MVRVWLDCDPGHDDAFALVLALFSPAVSLFGVSTTAGNQTLAKTTLNARRMLAAVGRRDVPVLKGVSRPLLASRKECPEIHGVTGLDFPPDCAPLAGAFEALATANDEGERVRSGGDWLPDQCGSAAHRFP
jgi:inosine-uridine nucleoside N-ribohydrolase